MCLYPYCSVLLIYNYTNFTEYSTLSTVVSRINSIKIDFILFDNSIKTVSIYFKNIKFVQYTIDYIRHISRSYFSLVFAFDFRCTYLKT